MALCTLLLAVCLIYLCWVLPNGVHSLHYQNWDGVVPRLSWGLLSSVSSSMFSNACSHNPAPDGLMVAMKCCPDFIPGLHLKILAATTLQLTVGMECCPDFVPGLHLKMPAATTLHLMGMNCCPDINCSRFALEDAKIHQWITCDPILIQQQFNITLRSVFVRNR